MRTENDRPDDGPVTLDELESILRNHEGPPQPRSRKLPTPPKRRRARLPWTLVAIAAALLVGSGLGFGLGSSATPTGSARSVVGFGFLPARGWTVLQTGTIDSSGAAIAIAANVPLQPSDDLRGPPYATIERLPAAGVVIHATFTTRGDPGEDFKFPARGLPLAMGDARRVPAATDPLLPPSVAKYRLDAGVRGYNVAAEIYVRAGAAATVRTAVQRQLNRLVVGAERVTIFARPTVLSARTGPVTFFGSIDSDKADEIVAIQAKQCGHQFFTGVASARTVEGGAWSTIHFPFPRITRTFRAVWDDVASAPLTLRQRAFVVLRSVSAGRFEVSVGPRRQFWRKRVQIQRFDRRLGTWTTVKSVVLAKQDLYPSASARFSAAVPSGTRLRAVFPTSQARPCFLGGTSEVLRT
jgi:hypothetical protein